MGSGFAATARDVAYAIVQRALGLATVEDCAFGVGMGRGFLFLWKGQV